MSDEEFLVELTRSNPPLARQELLSVLRWEGGRISGEGHLPRLERILLPGSSAAVRIASRLGNGRAIYRTVARGSRADLAEHLRREGSRGRTIRLRAWPGSPTSLREDWIRHLGQSFVAGGGRVDLERPDLELYLAFAEAGTDPHPPEGSLLAAVGTVDRAALRARRSARLPFRQPVTLAPWLARTLVNLAEVPPGGTLLDPFCGTGAIPIEAALLGYETWISDLSPKMLQGALRNFAASIASLSQGWVADLAELPALLPPGRKARGLVTDPPYGRSSASGKEAPRSLWARLLELLPELLVPEGTAVLLLPVARPDLPLPAGWQGEMLGVAQRVHAGLTRYVYRVRGPGGQSQDGPVP